MTEKSILTWIKSNLGAFIRQAIANTPIPENIIAGMIMRETGLLIQDKLKLNPKANPAMIGTLMRGDYSQRLGETEKQFRGYGFLQIDIASFPDFVKSGDWKDPFKAIQKGVSVLQDKKRILSLNFPKLLPDELLRASIAAYNCGQAHVIHCLSSVPPIDIDFYTYSKNYSAEVLRFSDIYKELP